jgi:hypothetical protein
MSIYSAMPTPPPEFNDFVATADPCETSLPPVLSSYEAAISSWFSENEAAWSSAIAECPEYASAADSADIGSCTDSADGGSETGTGTSDADDSEETGGSNSGSGSGSNSGSGSGSSSGSGSGSSSGNSNGNSNGNGNSNSNGNGNGTKKNAAHRETGLIGTSLAAAAFLVVVAAL